MGKSRKIYALAVLALVLAAALVAASSALALPTFTAAAGGSPACESCHASAGPGSATPGLHTLTSHSSLSCSTCHTVNTATPPTPGVCGGCHGGINHIVVEPTHSTLTCTTCHQVPAGATITSLTPNHGAAGASVTIAGTGFGATQGTGTVKFGTTTATSITSWSDTSIVVKVPSGLAAGSVQVTVTPNGGTVSNPVAFAVERRTSKITIKLVGLTAGAIKVNRVLTVKGAVTPGHAAKVTITLQRKVKTKWVKMKVLTRTSNATSGAYSAKYKVTKKGPWRVMSKAASTAKYTTAHTAWKTFKVK